MSKDSPARHVWRIKTVQQRTDLSRSTIYHLIKKGAFPKPRKLGQRASGWDSLEVQEWIDSRMAGGLRNG